MEDIICDLTLQCDTYMQEVHKAFISLTMINDELSVFNIPSLLVDPIQLLVREVAKKNKALAFVQTSLSSTKATLSTAQEDLEIFLLENFILA